MDHGAASMCEYLFFHTQPNSARSSLNKEWPKSIASGENTLIDLKGNLVAVRKESDRRRGIRIRRDDNDDSCNGIFYSSRKKFIVEFLCSLAIEEE